MKTWLAALFAAAAVSGLAAFGLVPSPSAALAQALFTIFSAVFGLLLLITLFGREHGGALIENGRRTALLILIGGFAVLAYNWIERGWTAEKVGRGIDRRAAALSEEAQLVWRDAGGVFRQTRADPAQKAPDDRQS